MTQKVRPVGGFVLVGGRSQRMGQDKALLELDGKPLVVRMVEALRPHVAEVKLLGPPARYAAFGLPVLADRWPHRGPLAAVCTGLESSSYAWNVFLACDLPLLEAAFLEFLLQRALENRTQAVVPRTAAGWQPLCGAYHRDCLPTMQRALEAMAGIVDVLETLSVDAPSTSELAEKGFSVQMFRNVNTPADWKAVISNWDRKQK